MFLSALRTRTSSTLLRHVSRPHSQRAFSAASAGIPKPTAAMRPTSVVPSHSDGYVVVDNRGAKWIRRTDPEDGKAFYYNEKTWETTDTPPETGILPRPKYATAWTDDRFPSWAQFIETNTMRKYYYNMSDGTTSWSHPESPDVDIFVEEHKYIHRAMTKIPDVRLRLLAMNCLGLVICLATCVM
jgi:hypothetical protein